MDGIILLDKPIGISSFKAIDIARKSLGASKAGHAGTLDPFASGLMIVTLDKATKINQFLLEEDKEYIATIKFGDKTDTMDLQGQIIESAPIIENSKEEILDVLNSFKGEQWQTPPMYSALKVDGKKLYELARKQIVVERTPRQINIYNIELLEQTFSTITIKVACSKGTYIRVLGEDIAKKLNNLGHLIALRRIKAGVFKIEDAFTLEMIKNNEYKLLNIIEGLKYFPIYNVSSSEVAKVKNGLLFNLNRNEPRILMVDEQNNCLAVYEKIESGQYKVVRGLW